ncbi:MAG: RdgB/HAM1 family non-canonical purine NTP pyrophosphatase [Blastocatellia bacterium]
MPPLLIATTNRGKIREISRLLAGLPYEITGLDSLDNAPPAPAETGETFAANALLKADYYARLTGWPTLADDSGLAVDALDGAPGVLSARYGGEGATDAGRIARLLDALRETPDAQRTARFHCCIALTGNLTGNPAVRDVREIFAGSCAGLITRAPRGENGFGYDPVFLDPSFNRTFAELEPGEKARVSHRGHALRLLQEFLQKQVL